MSNNTPSEISAPATRRESSNRGRYLLRLAAMTAVYFLAAALSNKFASVQANTSPVWLPSGLAVGALILFGYRYAPAILIGVLLVDMTVFDFGPDGEISFTNALLVSIGIGFGNVSEAVAAVWLIKKYANGIDCLARASTVFRFVLFGALLPPLLSAAMGVISLNFSNLIEPGLHAAVFLTWMTGDAVGILTITPLMLCLWRRPLILWKRRPLESIAMLVLLAAMSLAIMGIGLPESLRGLPRAYMIVPLIFWAALRLGRPVTVISVLLLSAITIVQTVRGDGILFPGPTPNHSLIYLQVFIGIVAILGLAVSALASELRRTHEGLEQAVLDRTVRLEQLLREKDDFLSIAVHELQSPLAGLRNIFQLLRSNPRALTDSSATELAKEMETAADTMHAHVQELLRTQRLEARIQESDPTNEDLAALLDEAVRAQRHTAITKDIALKLSLPRDPIRAITRRDNVLHILGNLLSNAIKFTPRGETIHLRLTRTGNLARYEIQDAGPGIQPGQMNRMFQKFQRSDAEPTDGEGSTGLGLYIVGKMVDQLGGGIRCRSIEGEGACFIFDLPLDAPADSP